MISVVIPLYNKQESIVATLQSVLAQTYQNFEIVVVDDGSTDNSARVVEELFEKHPILQGGDRGRLIKKNNGGVSSARNEGIRLAKFNYVAFLDADDYWEPTYLETQVKMIQDFPDAKMWGTAWGTMIGTKKYEGHGVRIAEDFRGVIDSTTYFSNKMYLYWTSIVIVDKRIFEHIEMFDELLSCGEDVDLWWRIILHNPVAYTNQCLAYYRQDTENRITLSKPKLQKHFINYIEKYEEYYEKSPEFKQYLQYEVLGHLYKYFIQDPQDENIKRILKQIDFSLQPFSYRLRYLMPKVYEMLLKLKRKSK